MPSFLVPIPKKSQPNRNHLTRLPDPKGIFDSQSTENEFLEVPDRSKFIQKSVALAPPVLTLSLGKVPKSSIR